MLYPLFIDVNGGNKFTVGPPYFDKTFVPLMVPVLVAVAVGPMLAWKRGDLLGALQRPWLAFAAAIAVALGGLYVTSGGPVLAVLGLGLAMWTGMGALVMALGGVTSLSDRRWRVGVASRARFAAKPLPAGE